VNCAPVIDDNVCHWFDACCLELLQQGTQLVDISIGTAQIVQLTREVTLRGGGYRQYRAVQYPVCQ
jgi:hypothetical protein